MKTILKHTLIICTLLSLSIPSNFLVGIEEEQESLLVTQKKRDEDPTDSVINEGIPQEKSIRSLCKKIVKIVIGSVLMGTASFGVMGATSFGVGYAVSQFCPPPYTENKFPPPPSYTPATPPPGYCPTVFQLNEPYNCSDAEEDLDPREGADLAAAVVRGCVASCHTPPNSKFSSFVNPKRMICQKRGNPNATAILQHLQGSDTFYSKKLEISIGNSFDRVTYEENDTFHLSSDPVSVEEIEDNPKAMQTLRNYLDFRNSFNPPCESFVIKDYNSGNQTQEYPLYPQPSKRNGAKHLKRSNKSTQRNKKLFQSGNGR